MTVKAVTMNEIFGTELKKVLGITTWWQVFEFENLTEEKVREVLVKHGLDGKLLMDLTARKAFSRACKSFIHNTTDKFDRKILENPAEKVVGIVKETKDRDAEKLEYEQTTTAKLNKITNTISIEGQDAPQLEESYQHFSANVTDQDIRVLIRRLISTTAGVSLRQSGGIYFVPAPFVEKLVQMDAVLRELGVGNMFLLRLPDGDAERNIAWESMNTYLDEEIKDILEKVEKIEKRAGCLSRHEERVIEAQALLECYTKLVEKEEEAEGIRDKLAEVSNRIAAKAAELKKVA